MHDRHFLSFPRPFLLLRDQMQSGLGLTIIGIDKIVRTTCQCSTLQPTKFESGDVFLFHIDESGDATPTFISLISVRDKKIYVRQYGRGCVYCTAPTCVIKSRELFSKKLNDVGMDTTQCICLYLMNSVI